MIVKRQIFSHHLQLLELVCIQKKSANDDLHLQNKDENNEQSLELCFRCLIIFLN